MSISDLMFVNNTNYTKFVNLNALADITELVQSETPELYDFIPEDLWRVSATIKEKVYASSYLQGFFSDSVLDAG